MSEERLFDPGPVAEPHVPESEPLSRDRTLTQSNQRQLARGVHPATLRPLDPDPDHRCGNCDHHHAYGYHTRTYHKCEVHRLGESHSAASDIRVSWPGCALWAPKEER